MNNNINLSFGQGIWFLIYSTFLSIICCFVFGWIGYIFYDNYIIPGVYEICNISIPYISAKWFVMSYIIISWVKFAFFPDKKDFDSEKHNTLGKTYAYITSVLLSRIVTSLFYLLIADLVYVLW